MNDAAKGSVGLRRRAEAQIAQRDLPSKVGLDSLRLLHELQVHQIELELQNEELLAANRELDTLRVRYQALYELAPVGYLTLSMSGIILEMNQRALEMFRLDHESLLNKPLRDHFVIGSLPELDRLLALAAQSEQDVSADHLVLMRPRSLPIYVRIQGRRVAQAQLGADTILMVLMDVSALKYAMDDVIKTIER